MRAIILHHFPFHYEMLTSCLEQFKDYQLDLYISQRTPDFENWYVIYRQLNKDFKLIFKITDKNYDLVILPTDDDKVMCNVYNQYLEGIPVYIINHIKDGNRSLIPEKYKRSIDIHGIHKENTPFHFCGFNYITPEMKIEKMNQRISVAIIGDVINEEENFFSLLKDRFTNFDDIDFYIINRNHPYWYNTRYSNIKYFISCNTQIMFRILEKCHYVYFFAYKRGIKTCSASIALAFSTLCKVVCCERIREQYNITSPLFKGMEEQFTLKSITMEDILEVEKEKKFLMKETEKFIQSLTKI